MSRLRSCILLGLLMFAACIIPFPVNAGDLPRNTTVCEIAKTPEAYAGKRVRLRAFLLSNVKYATILADRGCNGSGINLADAEWNGRPINLVKDAAYRDLDTLRPKVLELYNKHQYIYGTFEGLFQDRSVHTPDVALPAMTLILYRVSDVHVSQRDGDKAPKR